ncbi:MAG: protein kinase [Deltaproteobacteria bacterium]|nr:protein kinase [Deltaproteobacteria bacterium]
MARYPIQFGKYLLLERVNVGGMAEVFKAKTFGVAGFEKLVAIKRILPTMVEDEEFIRMFIDEARISVQLAHANIVQIYELAKQGDHFYMAMEYVPSRDLRTILDKVRANGSLLSIPQAAFVASKICDALDYAHRKKDPTGNPMNIIHRDVSPQNVLVGYEGEVKVIDFGIAKAANRASKTQAGVLKGKFGYMSPEQVRGLPIDRRSDIFAVGVLLYEMLTGERLFIGESDFSTLEKVRNAEVVPPTAYNKKVNKELEGIVMKALAREVEDRYQWASDLAEDLQPCLIEERSIYSTKKLAGYMREAYAAEIALEQAKMEEYLKIQAPVEEPEPADEFGPEKTFVYEASQALPAAGADAGAAQAAAAPPASGRRPAVAPQKSGPKATVAQRVPTDEDPSTDPAMEARDDPDFVDHGASDEADARTSLSPPPDEEAVPPPRRPPPSRAGLPPVAAAPSASRSRPTGEHRALGASGVGAAVAGGPSNPSLRRPTARPPLTPPKSEAAPAPPAAAKGGNGANGHTSNPKVPATKDKEKPAPQMSGMRDPVKPTSGPGRPPTSAKTPLKDDLFAGNTGELLIDPSAQTQAVQLPLKPPEAAAPDDKPADTGAARPADKPAEKTPIAVRPAPAKKEKDNKGLALITLLGPKKVAVIGGALVGLLALIIALAVLVPGGKPKEGTIRVEAQSGGALPAAEVVVDGEVKATGVPALLAHIPTGQHTVMLRGPGLLTTKETVTVTAGGEVVIQAEADETAAPTPQPAQPTPDDKKGDAKCKKGKGGKDCKEDVQAAPAPAEKKEEEKKEVAAPAEKKEEKRETAAPAEKKEEKRETAAPAEKKKEEKRETAAPAKKEEERKPAEKKAEKKEAPPPEKKEKKEATAPEKKDDKKEPATLVIGTMPTGADVVLDGKATGLKTPVAPAKPLQLSSGKHTLQFVTAAGKFKYTVTLAPGVNRLIIPKLGEAPKEGNAQFVP